MTKRKGGLYDFPSPIPASPQFNWSFLKELLQRTIDLQLTTLVSLSFFVIPWPDSLVKTIVYFFDYRSIPSSVEVSEQNSRFPELMNRSLLVRGWKEMSSVAPARVRCIHLAFHQGW